MFASRKKCVTRLQDNEMSFRVVVVGDGSVHGCWILHVQLCPGWRTSLRARQKGRPEVRAATGKVPELSCLLLAFTKFLLRILIKMLPLGIFRDQGWTCLGFVWHGLYQKPSRSGWTVPAHHSAPSPQGPRFWASGGNTESDSAWKSAGWLYPFFNDVCFTVFCFHLTITQDSFAHLGIKIVFLHNHVIHLWCLFVC